nr:immunoglobulin heavy chain junction region [Macaca mulatta]MOW79533.1 immunoglobulin heavy chain junction region [Macaca mulatta]MOW82428.1 immunoglobulin heavy chain junction region [Macaca mulatta]MOW85143.1 immunoglobulin heavy chain junction region [Macaca mulatta]
CARVGESESYTDDFDYW